MKEWSGKVMTKVVEIADQKLTVVVSQVEQPQSSSQLAGREEMNWKSGGEIKERAECIPEEWMLKRSLIW